MTDRIVLIVNPAATRAGPRLRNEVIDALTPLGLMNVSETSRGGDGSVLAAQAIADGATIVVAMGGDGTVNQVADALAGTQTALMPVPAGSTNVFARAVGWPQDTRAMLPLMVDAIRHGRCQELSLGRIAFGHVDRVFCVNAGIGPDADTIHLVEARPWLKTRFRHMGVGAATFLAAAKAARRPHTIITAIDGGVPRQLNALLVACGAPYAFLGSRRLDLVPGAAFDGRLRWVGVRSSTFTATVRVVTGALRGGRHLDRRSVDAGWAASEVVVTSDRPVAVQTDGEPLGWHTAVRLTPGPVLRTVVPGSR